LWSAGFTLAVAVSGGAIAAIDASCQALEGVVTSLARGSKTAIEAHLVAIGTLTKAGVQGGTVGIAQGTNDGAIASRERRFAGSQDASQVAVDAVSRGDALLHCDQLVEAGLARRRHTIVTARYVIGRTFE